MQDARSKTIGLRTGLIILGVIAALGLLSLLRLDAFAVQAPTEQTAASKTLEQRLTDPVTANYLEHLQSVSPAGWRTLESEAQTLIRTGASDGELADLILLSILVEAKRGAAAFKQAPIHHYDRMIDHAEAALTQLKRDSSQWCEGPHVAAYLELDDSDLIPTLIALYPYQSESYNWAIEFGTMALNAIEAGRQEPNQRRRPSSFDKLTLQQTIIMLGAEQPFLLLQVAAFSKAEGESYQDMKTAVRNMQVCDLGLLALSASDVLPEYVRANIWADLLPELFHGNMPYVIWRVNDYFYLD